jgi:beta-phosphoglucomutase family hydrolase
MKISDLKAVIWDMDGVIADTASLHFRSWQIAFAKRGVTFTEEDFKHHFGQRNDAIIRSQLGMATPDSEIEPIARDKEEYFRQDAKGKLAPFEGVVDLLNNIRGHGFLCAVASSAPLENIQLILSELGIEKYFQTVVYGKEVMEGKPSPQVFFKAAERLGVEAHNCIVIEDAVVGVTAAKKAGMSCIAVTNTHPTGKLIEADMVVESLVLVGIDDLNKLFGKRPVA